MVGFTLVAASVCVNVRVRSPSLATPFHFWVSPILPCMRSGWRFLGHIIQSVHGPRTDALQWHLPRKQEPQTIVAWHWKENILRSLTEAKFDWFQGNGLLPFEALILRGTYLARQQNGVLGRCEIFRNCFRRVPKQNFSLGTGQKWPLIFFATFQLAMLRNHPQALSFVFCCFTQQWKCGEWSQFCLFLHWLLTRYCIASHRSPHALGPS